MPVQQSSERLQLRSRMQVSWRTIALFAVVLAFADGFWMITLQGAVGAVERAQTPFASWLRESTVLALLYGVAVVAALLLARRLLGRRRPALRLAGTVALLVAATTLLGVAAVAATSAYDYRSQSRLLGLTHSAHVPTVPAQTASAAVVATGSCDALCQARRETVSAHVRAVGYGSVALLVTNAALVLWLLALLGGRLWSPAATATATRTEGPDERSDRSAVALV